MYKYQTIQEFLEDQPAEKLEQIEYLRQLILSAEPSLTETIKWNAPNFAYNGEDRITFNLMNKEGVVKLILHMGASIKEDKKAPPIMPGFEDIIKWNSNIRGTIRFNDMADLEAKSPVLARIIPVWLKIQP